MLLIRLKSTIVEPDVTPTTFILSVVMLRKAHILSMKVATPPLLKKESIVTISLEVICTLLVRVTLTWHFISPVTMNAIVPFL